MNPSRRLIHVRAVSAFLVLLAGLTLGWLGARPARAEAPARTFDRAMMVPIEGEITDITTDSVRRRLNRVRAEGTPLVIFQLNTPGGALGSTLKICHEIKRLRDNGVKTYAWIDNEAYSAGTVIALATDGIIMAPNATMGDCQPIMITDAGAAAVPSELQAKFVSPVIEELRDSARRNNYNLDMVFSMVRPNTQIFWVVDTQRGDKRFVDAVERNDLFGWTKRPGHAESAPADAATVPPSTVPPSGSEPLPDDQSRTSWRYVHRDPLIGDVRQPITGSNELLTMRDKRAQAFGFSLATVANEAELRSFARISGPIEHTDVTWMESAVQWLASAPVRAVLLMIIMLGVYAEFHAPGVSLPGGIALLALVLFLGAPYMAGFTVTWEIVVIAMGLVLLALEIFVIPGFGVVGLAGLILLGFGILSSFAPAEPVPRHWFELPALPQTYSYLKRGVLAVGGGFTASIIAMCVLARYLPRAPIMNRIIAPNPTRNQVLIEDPYQGIAKIGDYGVTETPLRPAGKARFGAMLVDVVSQGDFIDEDQPVEVIERAGSRVVVRRQRA